jgi:hypothetical protein
MRALRAFQLSISSPSFASEALAVGHVPDGDEEDPLTQVTGAKVRSS